MSWVGIDLKVPKMHIALGKDFQRCTKIAATPHHPRRCQDGAHDSQELLLVMERWQFHEMEFEAELRSLPIFPVPGNSHGCSRCFGLLTQPGII